VAKTEHIELPSGERIPILYEDRSVLAIDKPEGWMLAPTSWQNTGRNLQLTLAAGIRRRDFWARSRNLKFLRFVHRLDADTTGVLLLAKSPGAVAALGALFEKRWMEKIYWAVVKGSPTAAQWSCQLSLAEDPARKGLMKVAGARGKEAETQFQVLKRQPDTTLVEARPLTGRTHQIRVHLAAQGHPVLGDALYGGAKGAAPLALRAVGLSYLDPFTRRRVCIQAPTDDFLERYGFTSDPAMLARSG
jgi:RluA family pseudouridine synthase